MANSIRRQKKPFKIDLDLSTPSSLKLNRNGVVDLFLVQAPAGQQLIGNRSTFTQAQARVTPTPDQTDACKSLLQATRVNSLTVLSFHPGLSACVADLESLACDRTIVGLAGIGPDNKNTTYIATGGTLHTQAKLSLSSDDYEYNVQRGHQLKVFLPSDNDDAVRWAVLNCHDYTNVDILNKLLEQRIEVLIVVTYNTATRLYWQYAIADIHRLFCYVVIANIAELGGSGVFAPFRRIGREKHAQVGAGGQVFGARGAGELQVTIPLDIAELRALRSEFAKHGMKARAYQCSRGSEYVPVVPSEHYMHTFDHPAGTPKIDQVVDVPIEWSQLRLRVAVAQLKHIGRDAYISKKYRIRDHETCAEFEHLLEVRLLELESRCRYMGKTETDRVLDLLVFPEVFIPRSFLSTLQRFSNRIGTIIVAGVDYPDGGEEENANECVVLRPNEGAEYYRKITRSQYDAHRDRLGNLMPMQRGNQLMRFVNDDGSGFGVLICYDYSHLDLLWQLNRFGRVEPLDLTVVVAHNPFGDLYRSCCIADAHRFYQYIIMSNVAEYGGSGVFGPVRTVGARQVLLDAGKGVETIAITELDLQALRAARKATDCTLQTGDFMRRPGIFQTT